MKNAKWGIANRASEGEKKKKNQNELKTGWVLISRGLTVDALATIKRYLSLGSHDRTTV